MALFVIKTRIVAEGFRTFSYESIDECFADRGLQTLFHGGLLEMCAVYCGESRIMGLPPALMSWRRFKEGLIANSATILRSRG